MANESSCLPASAPADADTKNRINKLIGYVVRNGQEFEDMVRKKEESNPKFSFLQGGEHSAYYKWALFCSRRHYSDEEVRRIEASHCNRLKEVPPGSLELTPEDKQSFKSMLANNTGSKECVKGLRKWTALRSHSMVSIAEEMQLFATTVPYGSTPQAVVFTKLLHMVYVVNDIFFNRSSATMRGPYTDILGSEWDAPAVDVVSCFYPRLSQIMRDAYTHAVEESGKQKLVRIIDLWVAKGFLVADQRDTLLSAMRSSEVPPPPSTKLHSPYPLDLPAPPAPPGPPLQPPPPLQVPSPNLPCPPGPFAAGGPPPPPGLPPPPAPLFKVDLRTCSVGTMVNVIRAALAVGQKKYSPLPATAAHHTPSPYVEPGRLEARVGEYYRKVNKVLGREDVDNHQWGRGATRDRSDSVDESNIAKRSKLSAHESRPAEVIADDNVGHTMLRGLGWQKGGGLGANGSGVVDPVQPQGNADKRGVGAGNSSSGLGSSEYLEYRGMMSSDYKTRFADRHS
mmetsp:Transcript_16610/g.25000  ORF Transcript_16610/g.25000 Transcript_16610/m.25000 type:complete len:510 (-) Transcript_16610:49-1578(-)